MSKLKVRPQFLAKKMRPKSGKQPNLAEKVRPHAPACGQSQKKGPPHAAKSRQNLAALSNTGIDTVGQKLSYNDNRKFQIFKM